MFPSFMCISHFSLELFFDLKIPLTFITIVLSYAHLVKNVITKLEILTYVGCLTGILIGALTCVCPSVTFSNNRWHG